MGHLYHGYVSHNQMVSSINFGVKTRPKTTTDPEGGGASGSQVAGVEGRFSRAGDAGGARCYAGDQGSFRGPGQNG